MVNKSRASVEKVGMVQRRPVQPLNVSLTLAKKLARALQIYGNDRAYTILEASDDQFKVWFEGASEPMIIKFSGEKPEII